MDAGRITIYPANGNPKIAALIMAFALYSQDSAQSLSDSILGVQVEKLSFSFDSEEALNAFASDTEFFRTNNPSNDGDIFPAYSSAYNAAKNMNLALHERRYNLTGIREIGFLFFSEEEGRNFLKTIDKYINDYFGAGAFTVK